MVAIGPQTERQSDFMCGQHGLPFAVLTDPGNAVAEKFGLVYTVPEYHRVYFRLVLVNIPFVNGDDSWRLPVPATYVIGKDRRVLFAEAHADFRVRPEPEEALAAAFAHRCDRASNLLARHPACKAGFALIQRCAFEQEHFASE